MYGTGVAFIPLPADNQTETESADAGTQGELMAPPASPLAPAIVVDEACALLSVDDETEAEEVGAGMQREPMAPPSSPLASTVEEHEAYALLSVDGDSRTEDVDMGMQLRVDDNPEAKKADAAMLQEPVARPASALASTAVEHRAFVSLPVVDDMSKAHGVPVNAGPQQEIGGRHKEHLKQTSLLGGDEAFVPLLLNNSPKAEGAGTGMKQEPFHNTSITSMVLPSGERLSTPSSCGDQGQNRCVPPDGEVTNSPRYHRGPPPRAVAAAHHHDRRRKVVDDGSIGKGSPRKDRNLGKMTSPPKHVLKHRPRARYLANPTRMPLQEKGVTVGSGKVSWNVLSRETHGLSFGDLADAVCIVLRRDQGLAVLNDSICRVRKALDLFPQGHEHRTECLTNLADCPHSNENRLYSADPSDRWEVGLLYQARTPELSPLLEDDRKEFLEKLATSLHSLGFLEAGTVRHLEDAISLRLHLPTSRNGERRTKSFADVANSLAPPKFWRGPTPKALEDAIYLCREELQLLGPHNSGFQSREPDGMQGQNRIIRGRVAVGIKERICVFRKVLEQFPRGDKGRSGCLLILADDLCASFKSGGTIDELLEEIRLRREVLELCPQRHWDRSRYLTNLAEAISDRFQNFGASVHLNEIIRIGREALGLHPPGDRDRIEYLGGLAQSLYYFYQKQRSPGGRSGDDLDEAIRLSREGLAYCSPNDPHRATLLDVLACTLRTRYETHSAAIADLHGSILSGRELLTLRPVGHPERREALNTLSLSLQFKSDKLGESLLLIQEAISLIPPGREVDWSTLLTLGNILLRQHIFSDESRELEEAASVCKEALALCPQDHPERPKLLALQDKVASRQRPVFPLN